MKYDAKAIRLCKVTPPATPEPRIMPEIPCEVYAERLAKVRESMAGRSLDALVIYCDKEHFANFNYLTGFDTRFEEGLLVVFMDGPMPVLLGNECLPLCALAKNEVEPVLCQWFSLPNQPCDESRSLRDILASSGLKEEMNVGIIGWKLFPEKDKASQQYCTPSFVVDAVKAIAGSKNVCNAADMFIAPGDGLRTVNGAHEIAYYEYGAAVASNGIMSIVNSELVGLREADIAGCHKYEGLPLSCHPILSVGDNTIKGLVSPTDKVAKLGDAIAACIGQRGGLSVRNGYIAGQASELGEASGFVDDLAIPYISTVFTWYEKIGIGVTGGEVYDMVNSIFPKEKYGWTLNPGHLIADEEWLSSPVYPGSQDIFKSGMVVQMDIIPAVEGYLINTEDGICIADEELQKSLMELYPEVYARMMERRRYMVEELGINLKPEILPMSNITGYYRPYFLNKELAFRAAE
jgi:Xaa-Pro aminopeptidase